MEFMQHWCEKNLCAYGDNFWPFWLLLAQGVILIAITLSMSKKKSMHPLVLRIALLGVICATWFHVFHSKNNRFVLFQNHFLSMPIHERQAELYDERYDVAQYIKRNFPQVSMIDFYSDITYTDLQGNQSSSYDNMFQYLLAPKKMFVRPDDVPADMMLFYYKDNFIDMVPDDFKIFYHSTANIAVAVKEELL